MTLTRVTKIPRLAEKADYNAKITEIESKILSITCLANAVALNAVEKKMHNVSNLVVMLVI